MNWVRFANAINKRTGSNTFNSDNSNIANIKKQPCQIIKLHITHKILKIKPMVKTAIVANYTYFTCIAFCKVNPSTCAFIIL